jgi:hypothetical protein
MVRCRCGLTGRATVYTSSSPSGLPWSSQSARWSNAVSISSGLSCWHSTPPFSMR